MGRVTVRYTTAVTSHVGFEEYQEDVLPRTSTEGWSPPTRMASLETAET